MFVIILLGITLHYMFSMLFVRTKCGMIPCITTTFFSNLVALVARYMVKVVAGLYVIHKLKGIRCDFTENILGAGELYNVNIVFDRPWPAQNFGMTLEAVPRLEKGVHLPSLFPSSRFPSVSLCLPFFLFPSLRLSLSLPSFIAFPPFPFWGRHPLKPVRG